MGRRAAYDWETIIPGVLDGHDHQIVVEGDYALTNRARTSLWYWLKTHPEAVPDNVTISTTSVDGTLVITASDPQHVRPRPHLLIKCPSCNGQGNRFGPEAVCTNPECGFYQPATVSCQSCHEVIPTDHPVACLHCGMQISAGMLVTLTDAHEWLTPGQCPVCHGDIGVPHDLPEVDASDWPAVEG